MALLDRLSSPDILIESALDERPAVVIDVHLGSQPEAAGAKLRHFMSAMNVGSGMVVTPESVTIFRNRFSSRDDDAVETVGTFPVPDELAGFSALAGPAGRIVHSRFERQVRDWLTRWNQAPPVISPNPLDEAMSRHILPYLAVASPDSLRG